MSRPTMCLLGHPVGQDSPYCGRCMMAQRDSLKQENKELRDAFGMYGDHTDECPVPMSDCSCGFDEAMFI